MLDVGIKSSGDDSFISSMTQMKSQVKSTVEASVFGAAKITIQEAKPTVPVQSGAAANSLTAYLANGAGVAQGGGTIEYYRWLEIGGESGRKHTTRRTVITEGRYIWPAYQRKQDDVRKLMEAELNKLVSQTGLS